MRGGADFRRRREAGAGLGKAPGLEFVGDSARGCWGLEPRICRVLGPENKVAHAIGALFGFGIGLCLQAQSRGKLRMAAVRCRSYPIWYKMLDIVTMLWHIYPTLKNCS